MDEGAVGCCRVDLVQNNEAIIYTDGKGFQNILIMTTLLLYLLGFGGCILLGLAIGEGIGELLNIINEIVGGLVGGIMRFILKPFHIVLKFIIGGAIVVGSFFFVYTNFEWYWLILVGYIWFAAFAEGDE